MEDRHRVLEELIQSDNQLVLIEHLLFSYDPFI